jgi:hypothetical protein
MKRVTKEIRFFWTNNLLRWLPAIVASERRLRKDSNLGPASLKRVCFSLACW